MSYGDMNKLMTLEAPTTTPQGVKIEPWIVIETFFGALWPVSANEQIQAGGTSMTITHKIRRHYKSILKPSWRIKYMNRVFEIKSIINIGEENREMDILVKEGVGG